jgi:uncharacterized membrane protein
MDGSITIPSSSWRFDMSTGRLEAFSDGVIAILITIMVLELTAPHGNSLTALLPLTPIFLSYVLSFIFLAIYWNNHHHLLQAAEQVNGRVLWANMHLLFWLSLIPFVTAWMGENPFSPWPVALYGTVLFLAAVAYYILTQTLVALHEKNSVLATAVGRDFKGKISALIYLVAIPVAFLSTWGAWISCGLYILVAILWLVPDRRIEKTMIEE